MMSLPVWIGLRYLRSKKRNGFVSFISLASVLGIALGVMALIIVLSVMNGFQKEIRGQMLSVIPHMEVSYLVPEDSNQWPSLVSKLDQNPNVLASAPYISSQALLVNSGEVKGALLKGIDPAFEDKVVDLEKEMASGQNFNALRPGEFGIILGADLALMLDVPLGGKVSVLTPEGNITPAGMVPRIKQFTLVGVVHSKVNEINASLAMIHIADAQKLFRMGDEVSGVRVRLKEPQNVLAIKSTILPKEDISHYWITDWTDQNRAYFEAVELEKKMMFIILMLIIMVAAFNLVSSLVMAVTEKQSDIAILRTLGLTQGKVMKVFITQGLVAGLLGTVFGVIFGCLIAWKIGLIVHFIEKLVGSSLINAQIYFIDYLPSDIHVGDVVLVALISVILSFLATLYPSYRAARTQPAEALRYE
ncbi:lipoprotein-releasing ABC transporter permease subunit [Neisseria sp. Ec49-e6-T10]|uniref:lipoprotein-releasing ABC transporter permease subunit n=1 Tax=Neisseria sp. Ec49-e6-T10 TaxID=3140744 RepID=UPI003EC0589E